MTIGDRPWSRGRKSRIPLSRSALLDEWKLEEWQACWLMTPPTTCRQRPPEGDHRNTLFLVATTASAFAAGDPHQRSDCHAEFPRSRTGG